MDRGRIERTAASWLVAALPIRVLLDVAHGIVLAGWSLGRIGGAVLAASFLVCAGVLGPALRSHPLRVPAAVFGALVLVGAVRSVADPTETARLVLLYLGPIGFGLAASVAVRDEGAQDALVRATAAAALVPIGVSVAWWLSGGADIVLHDYPRLVGPYSSHHNHAVAMGLFVVIGAHLAFAGSAPGALVAVVASALLWLTYVRTVQIFVVVALLTMLLARGRWRATVGLAVVAVLAVLVHPTLRERFADVIGVLTLNPPEEGWGAVGSWRFRIWADSWQRFVAEGPVAWAFGLGLGAHRTLHKTLDPHNEYLTLWYQLGIAGPVVYVWMLALSLREALDVATRGLGAHARAIGALASGLLVAVILTSAISNDFLPRPLLATFVWGVAGLVFALSWDRGGAPADAAPRPPRSA